MLSRRTWDGTNRIYSPFSKELEKQFIVINWDQRGAGKSFSLKDFGANFTIEQFVSDAKEVIQYVLKRFNKQKLFLAGHSWGSIIGLNIAHQYPKYIEAYIGIGQIVHMKQNEELLYQHLIHSAKNMIIKGISFPFKIRQTTIFRYETSHYSKKVAWHIWRRNPKRIFLFFHTKRFLFS